VDLEALKVAYRALLANEAFLTATGRATAAEEYVRRRIDLALTAMAAVG
jgi:hypothetical protein